MNNIISKISEIEASAAAIVDAAGERKKEYAKEMEEKAAAFDRGLEEKTAGQLKELRDAMELEAKRQLDTQRQEAEDTIRRMEENYRRNHARYVENLFLAMTKE